MLESLDQRRGTAGGTRVDCARICDGRGRRLLNVQQVLRMQVSMSRHVHGLGARARSTAHSPTFFGSPGMASTSRRRRCQWRAGWIDDSVATRLNSSATLARCRLLRFLLGLETALQHKCRLGSGSSMIPSQKWPVSQSGIATGALGGSSWTQSGGRSRTRTFFSSLARTSTIWNPNSALPLSQSASLNTTILPRVSEKEKQ